MAIISVGYDGAVTESQWSDMIKKIGSAEYGVVGATDWKVSSVAAADRTVSVSAGKGWGHGVFDENTAPIQIQLDTVASGTRWDLIAMRRDWTGIGGLSTFVAVQGTSAKEIPVGRLVGPGSIDEQPVALVRVVAGSTAVAEIIDLRCWSGNGGMTARNDLALAYMKAPGGQVHINGVQWNCELDPNLNPVWTTFRGGYAPVYGVGQTLAGGIPNTVAGGHPGSDFLIQAGSQVAVSDGFGNCRLTFPKAFPNGLLTVMAINGEDAVIGSGGLVVAGSGNAFFGASGFGSRADWVYVLHGYANANNDGPLIRKGGTLHRINWIAIGW